MRFPALTRVLSVVLVLVCLGMAAAGGLGLSGAEKERRNLFNDMERLLERVEEYRTVTAELEGARSYDERSDELDEKQKQHDKESSEHRMDLTTYTATQYGLKKGTEAMDLADMQFAEYRAMFESGMASFEAGLAQASGLLSTLWQLYNTASGVLSSANAHLNYANQLVASLDAGEVLTYARMAEVYDEFIRAADEAQTLLDTLHGMEGALDALAAYDVNSLTNMAGGMAQLEGGMAALGSMPTDAYAETGVDIDLGQLLELKSGFDQTWATVKQAMHDFDAVLPQLEAQTQAVTGMNFTQLRQTAEAQRNEMAAKGDAPLEPQESAAIYAAYGMNRDQLRSSLAEASAKLAEINAYAAQAYSLLSTLQTQFDSLRGYIASAKQMIADAADALFYARALIWYQMGQQEEKEEELLKRKERLDQEAGELEELAEQAEARKSVEQRQRSLRAILRSRDEIRRRSDDGEDLAEAAADYAQETEREAEESYQARRRACLRMLVGAACGLLGIPAAFEQLRGRFFLFVPVLLCMGCAAWAELIFRQMGRGDSYSALTVIGFALLLLAVSAPKPKRKKQKRAGGKHLAHS